MLYKVLTYIDEHILWDLNHLIFNVLWGGHVMCWIGSPKPPLMKYTELIFQDLPAPSLKFENEN